MTGAHRSRYPRYHAASWWEGLCYRGVHRGVYDWMIGSRIERRDVQREELKQRILGYAHIEIQPDLQVFDTMHFDTVLQMYQQRTDLPPWVWR